MFTLDPRPVPSAACRSAARRCPRAHGAPKAVVLIAAQAHAKARASNSSMPLAGRLLEGILADKADHACGVAPLVALASIKSSVRSGLPGKTSGKGRGLSFGWPSHRGSGRDCRRRPKLARGEVARREPQRRPLPLRKELDQHRRSPRLIWASWRSRQQAARDLERVEVSAATTCARFSQRAIWLRLPPIRPTASTSAGSTRGIGLAPPRFGQAKRLAQQGRCGRPAASALARKRGLLCRCAPEDEGLGQRLFGAGSRARWGSKGRHAAPRKVPCQQRQRMTWVALLFALRWDRLRS